MLAPLGTHVPVIETDRLRLSAPAVPDFEHWAAFFASPRSAHERGPMERRDAWRTWAGDAAGWLLRGYGPWGVEDRTTGAYLGEVGIYQLESYPEPELGWFVVPEAEGRGIAFEAGRRVLDWAREATEWTRLVNYIDPRNDRSIALGLRLGGVRDESLPSEDPGDVVIRHDLRGDGMSVTLFNTPTLETERLILRAPKAEDWPVWRAFMASERSRFMRREDLDDDKLWRGFGHVIGHWVLRGYGSFVFAPKGEETPLGMTGPWHPFVWPEREIGWSVWSPETEGKGYAFEAARAARAHAFDTLGWDTAVSYVDPQNARSIALAERLGAVRDGSATTPWDEPCLVFRHPRPQEVAA